MTEFKVFTGDSAQGLENAIDEYFKEVAADGYTVDIVQSTLTTCVEPLNTWEMSSNRDGTAHRIVYSALIGYTLR